MSRYVRISNSLRLIEYLFIIDYQQNYYQLTYSTEKGNNAVSEAGYLPMGG